MTTAETHDSNPAQRVGWQCFAALVPGFLFTNVEGTLVNIALPSLQQDLSLSIGVVGWIPLACLLATASLSPLAGVTADRFGRRRVYLAGLSTVAVGSAMAALSPAAGPLVAARIVQGAGASAIVANGLAIIAEQFGDDQRGRALGRMTALMAVGGILAPVAGGALAEYVGWRSIFWLEGGGVAVGIYLVSHRLPHGLPAPSGWWRTLPWTTATLLVAAATAALGGLWGVGAWGPLSAKTLVAFAVAGAAGYGTFVLNRSGRSTLLKTSNIPRRTAWALATLCAGSGVLAGLGFVLPLYLAHTAGLEGLRLGLEVLPFPLGLVAGALAGGRYGDSHGSELPVKVGLVLTGAGLLAYGRLGMAALALTGVGLGSFSVGTNAEIISGPGAEVGTITGLAGLLRRAGQVTGVAVATIVLQVAGPTVGIGWLTAGVAAALLASLPTYRKRRP